MISTVKNDEGYVISYLEWRQVGQSGFDKLRGEYVWINDLWMHPSLKYSWQTYRDLMNHALFKAMDAKWVYFKREKYHGRMSKLYSRERLMRLLLREEVEV